MATPPALLPMCVALLQVVHQGASQHKQNMYIKRLQQLAEELHIPKPVIAHTQAAAAAGLGARLGASAAEAAAGGHRRNRKRLRLNVEAQTVEIVTVDLTGKVCQQQQDQNQRQRQAQPSSSELTTLASYKRPCWADTGCQQQVQQQPGRGRTDIKQPMVLQQQQPLQHPELKHVEVHPPSSPAGSEVSAAAATPGAAAPPAAAGASAPRVELQQLVLHLPQQQRIHS